MRHAYPIAALALLGSFSSSAAAETPGSWSVSIERVFGFSRATTKTEINGQTNKNWKDFDIRVKGAPVAVEEGSAPDENATTAQS